MKGRYRAKHFRNTEHTGFRRLLSVILCLCLLASVLQIQMITAFAAAKLDSVTVTHEGKKTEKLILPQNAEEPPSKPNVLRIRRISPINGRYLRISNQSFG